MTTMTIAAVQHEQTMTSRQIADAVGSAHHNVLSTIRRLIQEGVIFGNETPYRHEQNGQEYTEFQLDYRNTMVVASGYSAELRARIIDRWIDIEKKQAAPAFAVPQTFADALRLAADQQETIQHQAAQLALAAPKVAFVDQYVQATTGSRRFREVAKLLGVKENAFRDFLFAEKIMYRLHGKLAAYAQHIDAGRFEMVAGAAPKSGHSYVESMFTAKGIEWVAGEWGKYKIRGDA